MGFFIGWTRGPALLARGQQVCLKFRTWTMVVFFLQDTGVQHCWPKDRQARGLSGRVKHVGSVSFLLQTRGLMSCWRGATNTTKSLRHALTHGKSLFCRWTLGLVGLARAHRQTFTDVGFLFGGHFPGTPKGIF